MPTAHSFHCPPPFPWTDSSNKHDSKPAQLPHHKTPFPGPPGSAYGANYQGRIQCPTRPDGSLASTATASSSTEKHLKEPAPSRLCGPENWNTDTELLNILVIPVRITQAYSVCLDTHTSGLYPQRLIWRSPCCCDRPSQRWEPRPETGVTSLGMGPVRCHLDYLPACTVRVSGGENEQSGGTGSAPGQVSHLSEEGAKHAPWTSRNHRRGTELTPALTRKAEASTTITTYWPKICTVHS